jgi:hypothetical protein
MNFHEALMRLLFEHHQKVQFAMELLILLTEHFDILHNVFVRWLFELQDVDAPEVLIL